MESIREGWLIKSPPEKRTQGRWKLFRAKWRKRYFVLYAPPAADIIPGMCAAILDYYGGKNLRHKHGTIDLTHCEEVLSQLDATFYQNIFGLRTKHKNKDRTYYLVADTEADMNEWVNSLCFVLGMKENVQDPVLSSPPTGPLPQPPRISLPSPTASLCNSAPSLPPPRSETLPVAHRGGRKIPNHARVQSLPGINERMNGDLEEWQNGQPANRTSRQAPPSAPPIIGPRDNHLTLRFVPPPPTSAIQRRSCILSTIPDRLVFEETPTPENSTTEYDHPRQSYYHQTPTADESNNNNNFGALRFSPGGLYNVPNRSAFRGTEPECLYKIPPRHSANFSNVDDVRYDVPASTRLSYDVPAKCLGQHSLSGEHYDVPQSSAPVGPRVQSPSQNGVNPVDIIESSHLLSVLQSLIDELPTLSSSSNSATGDRIPKTPLYCNMDGQQGGCLDGKISSRELLSLSPPVPGPGTVEMVQHSYINAANGNTERVARSPTTSVSSSTSPSSGNLQYAKPRDVARHPAYSPVPTANDPICFTHRSKSFKRTQESLQNDPLPLPIKRISEVDDSSSISDDDETCNNSSCVPDSASQPKPSIYDVVPLPNKQNLFCAPQVPKDSEVIKYLDLDLEDGSVPEKSAAAGKSFETLGNATGVHYKEIDWCKTNALTETRREVENTRRTGERTLGD